MRWCLHATAGALCEDRRAAYSHIFSKMCRDYTCSLTTWFLECHTLPLPHLYTIHFRLCFSLEFGALAVSFYQGGELRNSTHLPYFCVERLKAFLGLNSSFRGVLLHSINRHTGMSFSQATCTQGYVAHHSDDGDVSGLFQASLCYPRDDNK